jgi:hypothetical protein
VIDIHTEQDVAAKSHSNSHEINADRIGSPGRA